MKNGDKLLFHADVKFPCMVKKFLEKEPFVLPVPFWLATLPLLTFNFAQHVILMSPGKQLGPFVGLPLCYHCLSQQIPRKI
jgi:hypothetical protein